MGYTLGRECYAIIDIQDYQLMNELVKGGKSEEEKGWLVVRPS